MLNSVELHVSPSCYECIAWSADGEIALAAGEYVQILTPRKFTPRQEESGRDGSKKESKWHITRFRANLFTNKEWPTIFPQDREDFSIGPEISPSSVVGLTWSPPGLAKYRRCTLAVLTSNLLLTFYQIVEGKWTRVAIVNKALLSHFETFIPDEGPRLRKTNIRAFAWCPPLKVAQDEDGGASANTVLGAQSRWGSQLLVVANDANDVILLHVRSSNVALSAPTYIFDILSLSSLHEPVGSYPMVHSDSVLAACLKSKLRISSMSCGLWVRKTTKEERDICLVTGNVAVVYGTKLKVIRVDARLSHSQQGSETAHQWNLEATSTEDLHLSGTFPESYTYRGPVRWLRSEESGKYHLAVSMPGGLEIASFSHAAYGGSDTLHEKAQIRMCFLRGESETATGIEITHWEPISAMTVAYETASTPPALHFGTVGGIAATIELIGSQTDHSPPPAPWKTQFDAIRERFDIDHDLGGMAIGRVWGLAAHNGVVAAAITVHPGDMVEYRTSAQERTTIIFSKASLHGQQEIPAIFQALPEFTAEYLRSRRKVVLGLILDSLDHDDKNPYYQTVVYAAACCALVDSPDDTLQAQARKAFEWLAIATGVDLTEELTKSSGSDNTVQAKPKEQLNGPGGHIFERCDICQAGIAWYSAQEAQCTSGHLFARCNLSFLSIQEPGISKFCSDCGIEYLNEDVIGQMHEVDFQQAYEKLSATFDTCVYCGGKFRA